MYMYLSAWNISVATLFTCLKLFHGHFANLRNLCSSIPKTTEVRVTHIRAILLANEWNHVPVIYAWQNRFTLGTAENYRSASDTYTSDPIGQPMKSCVIYARRFTFGFAENYRSATRKHGNIHAEWHERNHDVQSRTKWKVARRENEMILNLPAVISTCPGTSGSP